MVGIEALPAALNLLTATQTVPAGRARTATAGAPGKSRPARIAMVASRSADLQCRGGGHEGGGWGIKEAYRHASPLYTRMMAPLHVLQTIPAACCNTPQSLLTKSPRNSVQPAPLPAWLQSSFLCNSLIAASIKPVAFKPQRECNGRAMPAALGQGIGAARVSSAGQGIGRSQLAHRRGAVQAEAKDGWPKMLNC